MAKWEYKTVKYKTRQEFEAEAESLGDDGWEVIDTTQVNGWTVINVKKPLLDNPLIGQESLTDLIKVISDPAKSLQLLEDLKKLRQDAIETSLKAERDKSEAEASTLTAKAQEDSYLKTQKIIDARRLEVEAQALALQTAQIEHQRNLEAHASAVLSHAEDVKNHKASIQSDIAELTSQKNQNEYWVSVQRGLLDKREAGLAKREADLDIRDKESSAFTSSIKSLLASRK